MDHNSEKEGLASDYTVRQKMLTREIQKLKVEKVEEVGLGNECLFLPF